jgi:NADH-quinone oxidoreductase subunit N
MFTDYLILMKSEWGITLIIFVLLLLKISKWDNNERVLPLVQLLLLLNFISGFFFRKEGVLFDGMFRVTVLNILEKGILNLGVYVIALVCSDWLRRSANLTEFFILMLSALLGMNLLISSGNLLMFFLSVELSSIPVAALANFDLEKRISSEAAMKMILSSAFSSGILLFGISLLYGITGTLGFKEIPGQLDGSPLMVLAFVFIFSSFAFKMSMVPFHLWTADVYEGAPVPVTSFLSVMSKGAFAFAFISVLFRVFGPLANIWYWMLVILAIATMIVGNLFAIRQQNLKRFLAFSSIAQVGFILVGISGGGTLSVSSVVFFVLIYLFSNLGAFGVVAVISTLSGKENIDDYKGLYRTNPFLSWVITLSFFSLAGIPPTAGFFGKLFLLTAGASTGNYWVIVVAALNIIVSLYYYLRVVRAIFMDPNEEPIQKLAIRPDVKLGLVICAGGAVLAGILGWIFDYISYLSNSL